MGDRGSASTVRMVRRDGLKMKAQVLRHPEAFDSEELLAIGMEVGTEDVALEIADRWLIRRLKALGPDPVKGELQRLQAVDLFNRCGIAGRSTMTETELGRASLFTDPGWSRTVIPYGKFKQRNLPSILDGEASRVMFADDPGAGKTHTANLFGEYRLESGGTFIVNFGGVHDPTGTYQSKIRQENRLSGWIRVWAESSPGEKILGVVDEPEAALKGYSEAVKNWTTFLNFIRKMNMDVVEIWHEEEEQYRGGRERNGPTIYRIKKESQKRFTISNKDRIVHVEEVPALSFLVYDDGAVGSFVIDVDMEKFLAHLAEAGTEKDRKKAALKALDAPGVILERWQMVSEDASEPGAALEKVIGKVVLDPAPFVPDYGDGKRRVDGGLVRLKHPHLSIREADTVAKAATMRLKEGAQQGETGEEE